MEIATLIFVTLLAIVLSAARLFTQRKQRTRTTTEQKARAVEEHHGEDIMKRLISNGNEAWPVRLITNTSPVILDGVFRFVRKSISSPASAEVLVTSGDVVFGALAFEHLVAVPVDSEIEAAGDNVTASPKSTLLISDRDELYVHDENQMGSSNVVPRDRLVLSASQTSLLESQHKNSRYASSTVFALFLSSSSAIAPIFQNSLTSVPSCRSVLVLFSSREERLQLVEELVYHKSLANPTRRSAWLASTVDARQSWLALVAQSESHLHRHHHSREALDLVANRLIRGMDIVLWERAWFRVFRRVLHHIRLLSIGGLPAIKVQFVSVHALPSEDIFPTISGVSVMTAAECAENQQPRAVFQLKADSIRCSGAFALRFQIGGKASNTPADLSTHRWFIDVTVKQWTVASADFVINPPPSDSLWLRIASKPTFELHASIPDQGSKLPATLLSKARGIEQFFLSRVRERLESGTNGGGSYLIRLSLKELSATPPTPPRLNAPSTAPIRSQTAPQSIALPHLEAAKTGVPSPALRMVTLSEIISIRETLLESTRKVKEDLWLVESQSAQNWHKLVQQQQEVVEDKVQLEIRIRDMQKQLASLRQAQEDFARRRADDLREVESQRCLQFDAAVALHSEDAEEAARTASLRLSALPRPPPPQGPPPVRSAAASKSVRSPREAIQTPKRRAGTDNSWDAEVPSAASDETVDPRSTAPTTLPPVVAVNEARTPTTPRGNEPVVPTVVVSSNVPPTSNESGILLGSVAVAVAVDGKPSSDPITSAAPETSVRIHFDYAFKHVPSPLAGQLPLATDSRSASKLLRDLGHALIVDCAMALRVPRMYVLVDNLECNTSADGHEDTAHVDARVSLSPSSIHLLQLVSSESSLDAVCQRLAALTTASSTTFRESHATLLTAEIAAAALVVPVVKSTGPLPATTAGDHHTPPRRLSVSPDMISPITVGSVTPVHAIPPTPSAPSEVKPLPAKQQHLPSAAWSCGETPRPSANYADSSAGSSILTPHSTAGTGTPRSFGARTSNVEKLRLARELAMKDLQSVKQTRRAASAVTVTNSSAVVSSSAEVSWNSAWKFQELVASEAVARSEVDIASVTERRSIVVRFEEEHPESLQARFQQQGQHVTLPPINFEFEACCELLSHDEAELRGTVVALEGTKRASLLAQRSDHLQQLITLQRQSFIVREVNSRRVVWTCENQERSAMLRSIQTVLHVDTSSLLRRSGEAAEVTVALSPDHYVKVRSGSESTQDVNTSPTLTRSSGNGATSKLPFTPFHYATFDAAVVRATSHNWRDALMKILRCNVTRDLSCTAPFLPGSKFEAGDVLLDVDNDALHSHSHLVDVLLRRAKRIQDDMLRQDPSTDYWMSQCGCCGLVSNLSRRASNSNVNDPERDAALSAATCRICTESALPPSVARIVAPYSFEVVLIRRCDVISIVVDT